MKPDSTLTGCNGSQCLANAGAVTPTLRDGVSISLGPFTRSSSMSGITCTLANAGGFLIAKAGITPLGRATVTSGSSSGSGSGSG